MQSKAKTVAEYLASLPEDRRAALMAVREVFVKNIDKDYEEAMGYGMPGWVVPHSVFPPGYHCDPSLPLPFGGMASQKNYMSVYLMCLYGDSPHLAWFKKAWAATGKKLDMGKSCIRFKKVEDLALDVIGEAIRRVPAAKYIEHYTRSLGTMKSAPAAKKAVAKKPAIKKASGRKPAAKKAAPKRAAVKVR
ncbi:MAG: DUF1801 domain-containing protein [Phycisphaerales bacterium]